MVRWYDSPEDERRTPLAMRPLVWRSRDSYGVELASTVAMRICVVPDYKRGNGNFLINDLAYLAPDDFLPVVAPLVPLAVPESEALILDSTSADYRMDL